MHHLNLKLQQRMDDGVHSLPCSLPLSPAHTPYKGPELASVGRLYLLLVLMGDVAAAHIIIIIG